MSHSNGNLILSRRLGESVIIYNPETHEKTKITVQKMWGHQVKLSFEAPVDVKIDREELHKIKYGE